MAAGVKEFAAWLGILGVPSLFAIVAAVVRWFRKSYKKMEILSKAQQAQMRAQLLSDYYKYMDRGTIYDAELSAWLNAYESYHELGSNGVMDAKKDRLLTIPTVQDN